MTRSDGICSKSDCSSPGFGNQSNHDVLIPKEGIANLSIEDKSKR